MIKKLLSRYVVTLCALLVASLALECALGIIKSSLDSAWVVRFEMSSTTPGKAYLLIDQGHGYNQSVESPVSGDGSFEQLNFPLPAAQIYSLRFDPIDAEGTVQINSIQYQNLTTNEVVPIPLSSLTPANDFQEVRTMPQSLWGTTKPGGKDPQFVFAWSPPASAGTLWSVLRIQLSTITAQRFVTSMLIAFIPALLAAARVVPGFVTSIATTATVAAYVLCPYLAPYFLAPHAPLRIAMSAPGARFATVRAEDTNGVVRTYATALRPIAQPNTTWDFQIQALGIKHPRSKGSAVTILDIRTPERALSSWAHTTQDATWRTLLTPSRIGPDGKIAVAYSTARLQGTIEGSSLQILLQGGTHAGRVLVSTALGSETIDLYSRLPEENILVNISPSEPASAEVVTISVPLSQNELRSLSVTTDSATPPTIASISLPGFSLVSTEKPATFAVSPSSPSTMVMMGLYLLPIVAGIAGCIITIRRAPAAHMPVSALAFAALALASVWGHMFYPGFMDKDSLTQWESAVTGSYYNWHPPALSFLMRASLFLWSDPAALCYVGGFLYWFSIFLVASQLVRHRTGMLLSMGIIAVNPVFILYSVSVTNSIWALSAALLSSAALLHAIRTRSYWSFAASCIALSVAVCFRHNYPSVAAVHCACGAILFFTTGRWRFLLKASLAVAVWLVATVPSKIVSALPVVQNVPYAMGIVVLNSYVGTIKHAHLPAKVRARYRANFDEHLGDGAFDRLQKSYICQDYFTYFSHPEVLSQEKIIEQSRYIVKQTARMALRYPAAYAAHKWCWTRNFMHVDQISYKDLVGVDLNRFGFVSMSKFPTLYSTLRRALAEPGYAELYAMYAYFIASMVLMLGAAVLRHYAMACGGLLSLFHFAGYFVTDVSACWRYNLFSYVLAWVMVLAFVQGVVRMAFLRANNT